MYSYTPFIPVPTRKHFAKVSDSEVTVICCGKSVLHIVDLKPVKDARWVRSDPTIHDSEMSILFVSRNYQSRPSAYLSHLLIIGHA